MAKIKITLTKSPIGYNKKQRATAQALGLRKMQSSVIQEDTPDIMGKIASIAHLVTWEQVVEGLPEGILPVEEENEENQEIAAAKTSPADVAAAPSPEAD